MTTKQSKNLLGFLRREVLRSRVQVSGSQAEGSDRQPSPSLGIADTDAGPESAVGGKDDVDSLFGEPIPRSRLSVCHQNTLTPPQQQPPSPPPPAPSQCEETPRRLCQGITSLISDTATTNTTTTLGSLKEELRIIVTYEGNSATTTATTARELKLIRRQRTALIQEISRLEAVEKGEKSQVEKGL